MALAGRQVRELETPQGTARLHISRARRPRATVLLSHGAGGGVDAPDLVALDAGLPRLDVTVIRLEQPWRVAGRKIAGPPASLDAALVAVASQLRTRTPLVLGGRSAGARSAARCARTLGASGVLALAFPLHPPGKPERSRLEELLGAGVPTLVVQGERDPFGRPEEFPADSARRRLVVVPEAGHELTVRARAALTPEEVAALIVEATEEWLEREVVGTG
ncbi:alpha/beta hydrolase family protein [Nocardioides massiliensis]|uniref:Alpha/beta-hydrolase family hydrolase n=1 Tax=Nocardioides massiliensis TaxID=1325935 RepID=A0ABT9NUP1_9ACTN|nr:alpha/beta family hydrolase [Nocardioides massiliensis]MDP9823874.1 putative alpha/beta-hydrolase family hydrolase [Nocardioides massiliensis]